MNLLIIVSTIALGVSACSTIESVPSTTTVLVRSFSDLPSTTVWDVQEPPAVNVGGNGLDTPPADEPDEIDCVDAESLCEEGVYACDDIADYCDIGPDGLEELPDEFDWDGN